MAKALHGEDKPAAKLWAATGLAHLWQRGPKQLLAWFDAVWHSQCGGNAEARAWLFQHQCPADALPSIPPAEACRLAPVPSKHQPSTSSRRE
jgi:hypothetical protein